MNFKLPQGFGPRPNVADPSKGKIFQDPSVKLPANAIPQGIGHKQGPSTAKPTKKTYIK